MDATGFVFPAVVAVVSLAGLWWHVKLARQGIATMRDRVMAGLWAAMIVLSAAWILREIQKPADGTTPTAPPSTPRPLGK